MLQEGEEALKEEVEGEEGAVQAEGKVVLLSVDELVTFESKTHGGNEFNKTRHMFEFS